MSKTIRFACQDRPGSPDALFAGCSGIGFQTSSKQGSNTINQHAFAFITLVVTALVKVTFINFMTKGGVYL